MSSVLVGEVGPAVADPVALCEGAVEQDVVRVGFAQGAQQSGRAVGEQVDDGCRVGVGGADGDAEADGELGEGVVPAQVHQADQGTLVRWKLAAAFTLAGDDEHGYPLDQGVGQVECGRIGNQRGSCADELRRRTPTSTARGPRALRMPKPSPDQWPRRKALTSIRACRSELLRRHEENSLSDGQPGADVCDKEVEELAPEPDSVVPVSGTGVPQLLKMYDRAIEDAASLAPFVLVHSRPSRWRFLKPLARFPRVTFGTRMFLIRHVERSLLTLERQYHVREALGELTPDRDDRDRSACAAYRKALPPSRYTFALIGFAVSAVIVASIIIQLAGRAARSVIAGSVTQKKDKHFGNDLLSSLQDSRLEKTFGEISKELVNLMTGGGGGDLPTAVGHAIHIGTAGLLVLVFITFVTGYVATRPLVSAFRLKRQILGLADQDELGLNNTASSWYVNKSVGAYEQERKVFGALERKPVPEKPVDLAILAFPAACLLALAILLAWWVTKSTFQAATEWPSWQDWLPIAFANYLYVVWLGALGVLRMIWLLSALEGRRDEESRKAPFVGKVRDNGLYVEARPVIEAAAWPMASGLLIFPWLLYPVIGAIQFHRIMLTGNRLRGHRGHCSVATLAFTSVVATPVIVSHQLWRFAALNNSRRNKILAVLACPALFTLPVAQVASLLSASNSTLSVFPWLFLCFVASGLLSALLYALLVAAVQKCQNNLIQKLADEVKSGQCEAVGAHVTLDPVHGQA